MKKLSLAIILLLPLLSACNKHKPVEVEMQLPEPAATPAPIIAITPTPTPTPTPVPDLEYSIEDIQGTALILTDDDTVPESAIEGETVGSGDELKTEDNSEITLALNDNTLVHIAANSDVKVAGLTPNATRGFSSRLELILGNILSEVEKLNESRSSFEIEAGGVVCAVRGTAFEVQKRGVNIGTSTFHGIVEMQKDGHVQKVNANQHSTFSLKRSGFLPQRHLNAAEKKHYKTWSKTMARVQEKRAARISGRTAPVQKTEIHEKPKPAGHAHSARPRRHAAKSRHAQKAAPKKRQTHKPIHTKPKQKVAPKKVKPRPRIQSGTRRPRPGNNSENQKKRAARRNNKKKRVN